MARLSLQRFQHLFHPAVGFRLRRPRLLITGNFNAHRRCRCDEYLMTSVPWRSNEPITAGTLWSRAELIMLHLPVLSQL